MIPKKALLTGELLEWQLKNREKLYIDFEKYYGKEHNDYSFWGCLYEQLKVNQAHVKQSLELGHFVACKDGKPLENVMLTYTDGHYKETDAGIFLREFKKAEKEILFSGWKIEQTAKGIDNAWTLTRKKQVIYFMNYQDDKMKTVNYESIEQLITQIPQIKITNYYNETFKN